ncbi:glycosyltransferase [Psychrobacillus soli]|uniref:Glycosyltransferase family 4 protein n=1 Tax=Psychrobacillus soli TaxID=1543965 RepID=A0A544TL30_9BACI|nr:glycosyltransferase [Psychrobacillus soli]TQR18156.1 glycosyltransferase family 4 protein [Psychrobacillus soli]
MTESKKVIKIMHISEATSGGVWTHLNQLADNLPKSRFKQTFILSSIKNPKLEDGLEFQNHNFHVVDMVREINPIEDIVSIIRICKILKKEKPDIVHCHSSKAGLVGRVATVFMKNVKVVYTPHAFAIHPHNGKLKNVIFSMVERFLAFVTTKIICVSYGEREVAIKYAICDSNKISVILNGVEDWEYTVSLSKEEWLQSYSFTGQEKIIGFLGRLAPQKDPLTFIELSQQFNSDKKVVFVMIGDGPLEEIVRQEVGENCVVIGYHARPRDIIQYFDIYVMTSLWEGLPYTLLESMNDGIPIVATNISGVNEIILHNKTGLLANTKDVNELSQHVRRLLEDPYEATKLSENAKYLINKKNKLNKMIKETEVLYSEL